MKHILIIGAGRSSTSLIHYLKDLSKKAPIGLIVADADLELAKAKAGEESERLQTLKLDIFDEQQLQIAIEQAEVVISMVPSGFHLPVAKACLKFRKHMLSASYVSDEILQLNSLAREAGVLILKECGLDPGLDHMTAMEVMSRIQKEGGELLSFKSFTGGLVAPDSDNNPWHYKFTWNPRNVVLAGQGTARYISKGEHKYIPYHKLFNRTEPLFIEGLGEFEGYANRDSVSYRRVYRIESVPTLLRGTIRRKGFCAAWNIFVQLGLTDDSYLLEDIESLSKRSYLNAFLPFDEKRTVEEKLCAYTGIIPGGEEYAKIDWLGFFTDEPLTLSKGTPAQVLQQILEEKWKLEPQDKDMVVMQHKFEYLLEGQKCLLTSSLVCMGEDQHQTAMAKTVGLPLGITARLLIEGKIKRRGVCIPISPDVYEPVLKELEEVGIKMEEKLETMP